MRHTLINALLAGLFVIWVILIVIGILPIKRDGEWHNLTHTEMSKDAWEEQWHRIIILN